MRRPGVPSFARALRAAGSRSGSGCGTSDDPPRIANRYQIHKLRRCWCARYWRHRQPSRGAAGAARCRPAMPCSHIRLQARPRGWSAGPCTPWVAGPGGMLAAGTITAAATVEPHHLPPVCDASFSITDHLGPVDFEWQVKSCIPGRLKNCKSRKYFVAGKECWKRRSKSCLPHYGHAGSQEV